MQLLSTLLPFVALGVSVNAATLQKRAVTNLPANGKFDYQIGGSYTPASDVKVCIPFERCPTVSLMDVYSGYQPWPKWFSGVWSLQQWVVQHTIANTEVTCNMNNPVCYINAFQTQDDEESFWTGTSLSSPYGWKKWRSSHDCMQIGSHSNLLLKKSNGDLFEDPDWPGEYFLDTSTDAKRQAIATILNGWIDGCASKGFQAIEPDNLDVRLSSLW
jgi:hypothetical protein